MTIHPGIIGFDICKAHFDTFDVERERPERLPNCAQAAHAFVRASRQPPKRLRHSPPSCVIERSLAHELQGTVHLDFRPDGLNCTMTIQIPRSVLGG